MQAKPLDQPNDRPLKGTKQPKKKCDNLSSMRETISQRQINQGHTRSRQYDTKKLTESQTAESR